MRFLGIVIPAALLVAFVVLLLLGFGVVGQTLRGRPFMGTVGVVGLLVMAAALPGAISTHIGYAVPWRQTPYHVLFRGRDYYHEGCDTQARRPLRSGSSRYSTQNPT